ncbi:FAD/NAD-P-binding domain-containing protein [Xylogone sp. PMI_703]|nr:FAD/NAD-P-binding domain-containing protein [Xylogone sp. PMI_703]
MPVSPNDSKFSPIAAEINSELEALPDKYGWPRENQNGYRIKEQLSGTERPIRVIHVGAGASGICFSKFASESLNNVNFVCYDKNSDIGGTWLENRYPGCACDIPSVNYQFTWARNPNWSHFYSYSEEIWSYFKDVVETFGLRKYIKLNHEIIGADWNESEGLWHIEVKNLISGLVFIDKAEVLINGGGVLNNWKWPAIEGIHDFQGTLCHTANYPADTILDGKRVAVVGVGSSGIQVTANIASKVRKLYTWVRSPTWITSGFAQKYAGLNGENFKYTEEQQQKFAENLPEYVTYIKNIEDELNQRFKFILNGTPEALEAKEFSTNQMQQKLQGREDLIKMIIPTDFGVGCRRPTPGNGFLEALTLPNVTTFAKEMRRITPKGFIDDEGQEHEVDVIICATGFDTSWIPRFPVIARGKNIQEIQKDKPISYISIGVPEIPNYWTVTGAYGPLGHGSFIPIIEHLMHHFIRLIKRIQTQDIKAMAPRKDVCQDFVDHADLYLQRTAWSSNCRSWFKQGRSDGPLSIWPGSRLLYFDLLSEPRYEDYDISYHSGNRFGYLGNGFTIREYNGGDLSYYLGTVTSPGALIPSQRISDTK